MTTATISDRDFQLLRDFIASRSGISLAPDKVYLIENRLGGLLAGEGFSGFGELYRALQDPGQDRLRNLVLDAMTTNETLWFRDDAPFRAFGEHLLPAYAQEIRDGKRSRVRIWSAACSTGQEPYSLAMVCRQTAQRLPDLRLDHLDILATDLSTTALAKARSATYGGMALDRGLPPEFRELYFEAAEGGWKVKEELRRRIVFREFNLQNSFLMMGTFDIILARYVLIYFEDELKREILRKIHAALEPGGVLFLGSSEGLPPGTQGFAPIRRNRATWFQKVAGTASLPLSPDAKGAPRPSAPGRPTNPAPAALGKDGPPRPGGGMSDLEEATRNLASILDVMRELNKKYEK